MGIIRKATLVMPKSHWSIRFCFYVGQAINADWATWSSRIKNIHHRWPVVASKLRSHPAVARSLSDRSTADCLSLLGDHLVTVAQPAVDRQTVGRFCSDPQRSVNW